MADLGPLVRQLQGAMGGNRIIRGTVATAGTVITGDGYSVSKTATGVYQVTFDVAFSSAPSVTATAILSSSIVIARIENPATTGVVVRTSTTAAATDLAFSFIAVGPS